MATNRKTVARGYNAKHKAERARWVPKVKAGGVQCARCGGLLAPDEPFDLDHTEDRTGYNGPAHVRCNRRAGAIKGNRIRRGLVAPVRRWQL